MQSPWCLISPPRPYPNPDPSSSPSPWILVACILFTRMIWRAEAKMAGHPNPNPTQVQVQVLRLRLLVSLPAAASPSRQLKAKEEGGQGKSEPAACFRRESYERKLTFLIIIKSPVRISWIFSFSLIRRKEARQKIKCFEIYYGIIWTLAIKETSQKWEVEKKLETVKSLKLEFSHADFFYGVTR